MTLYALRRHKPVCALCHLRPVAVTHTMSGGVVVVIGREVAGGGVGASAGESSITLAPPTTRSSSQGTIPLFGSPCLDRHPAEETGPDA